MCFSWDWILLYSESWTSSSRGLSWLPCDVPLTTGGKIQIQLACEKVATNLGLDGQVFTIGYPYFNLNITEKWLKKQNFNNNNNTTNNDTNTTTTTTTNTTTL